jgi:hypothetical protein
MPDRTDRIGGDRLHAATRRTFMMGAAAGVGMGFLLPDAAWADAEHPEPSPSSARASGTRSLAWLSSDLGSAMNMDAPTALRVHWPTAWGRRLRLQVTGDARLLDIGPVVAWEQGDAFALTGLTSTRDGDSLRAEALIALTGIRPGHPITVSLPVIARDLYPSDNLGDVTPMRIRISDAAAPARSLNLTVGGRRAGAVAAWGAELIAAFGPADAANAYRAPLAAILTSVGPTPSPDGLILQVSADSSVVQSLDIAAWSIDGRSADLPARRTEVEGSRVTLLVAVPPMSPLSTHRPEFVCSVASGGSGKVLSTTPASMSLSIDDDTAAAARFRRDTRRYTAVDVTSSGSAVTTGV